MMGYQSVCRLRVCHSRRRLFWQPRRSSKQLYPPLAEIPIYNPTPLGRSDSMDAVAGLLAFMFFGFIAIVLLVIGVKTIRIVPQATVMLVERLGRFHQVANSGLNILWPFIDKPRAVYWTNTRPGLTSIDLREQYIDLPPQPVITRDNVTIHVDSVVYWQITDPIKAVYEMNDLVGGIVQLTITGMRAVMGDM